MAFKGAMVKKSTDQTTANYSAGAMIAWDAEIYDTDAFHDNSTDNSRLTVPSGITRVIVQCSLAVAAFTASTNALLLEIAKNGTVTFDGCAAINPWPAGSATTPFLNVSSGPIDVTAGDYFEMKLTSADTSITITANRSNFSIHEAK